MPKTFKRRFTYRFEHPVEVVWQALADTARFNEAAGLPRHEITEEPQEDGSLRVFARGRIGRVELAWEEFPVEWVYGKWFWHRRGFSRGPIATLGAMVSFESIENGCLCHYEIGAAPRTLFGWLVLLGGFFRSFERNYRRLCRQVAEWAEGEAMAPYKVPPLKLQPAAQKRIDAMVEELEASPYGHGIGPKLVDWILQAQEVDIARIRPLALANRLGVDRRKMVEAALQGVRVGLLQQRWDLLCPRCRGAKLSVESLDTLPETAHCRACNIDYGRDFSRNIELTFQPAPALRPVHDGEYCLGGPMSMPHIMAQVRLESGGGRDWPARLPAGPYRLRTLDPGPYAAVDHDGNGFPTILVGPDKVTAGARAPDGVLHFRNNDTNPRFIVIERRDWSEEALTGERVTALQAFRDICAADRLRPGDGTGVDQVALMFTDLKSSTALYRAIGDAPAYGQVRSHFAFLAGLVREHEGAVIKTMGDAVLAAFAEPADAVAAALSVQRGIADFNRDNGANLAVKIGIHAGPCLVVTLNDRLDYFGQTVNLAARLQGQSLGGDIVLSERIRSDPMVRPLIDPLQPVPETARLPGIDETASFWRLVRFDAAEEVPALAYHSRLDFRPDGA